MTLDAIIVFAIASAILLAGIVLGWTFARYEGGVAIDARASRPTRTWQRRRNRIDRALAEQARKQ